MDVSVLGIDLGKNSCSVVGLDAPGKVVVRRRMRRETVITYAASLAVAITLLGVLGEPESVGSARDLAASTIVLGLPTAVGGAAGRIAL